MRALFSILLISFTFSGFSQIQVFYHNFFNFYRKSALFHFTINSNGGIIAINAFRDYTTAKRNVTPLNHNEDIYLFGDSSYGDPLIHHKGDSAKGFIKPIGIAITYDPPRIGIHGKGDVYLMMFRLNPDSSRNYGWLKFNISADCDSLYFISSGFNTIINDPVVAGEGEWALSKERFSENFKLFPNPSNSFKLELPENYSNEKINLEIIDLNGKVVHKCPYHNNPYSLTIKPGMYWVIIKNENEILAKIKWMKE